MNTKKEKPEDSARIKELKKRQSAIGNEIKRIQAQENKARRTAENRKKLLAGAAALDEAEKNPAYKENLYRLIDRFYKRPDERAIFGLPPLPGTEPKSAEAKNEKPVPSELEDA